MTPVNNLSGAELDYWVAQAEGYPGAKIRDNTCYSLPWAHEYNPSEDGQLAMELVEKYKIDINYSEHSNKWLAVVDTDEGAVAEYGETPHIAICRCVVASVYGDEVNENT